MWNSGEKYVDRSFNTIDSYVMQYYPSSTTFTKLARSEDNQIDISEYTSYISAIPCRSPTVFELSCLYVMLADFPESDQKRVHLPTLRLVMWVLHHDGWTTYKSHWKRINKYMINTMILKTALYCFSSMINNALFDKETMQKHWMRTGIFQYLRDFYRNNASAFFWFVRIQCS